MNDTPKENLEVWTYVGRRIFKGGLLVFGFIDEQGKERFYKKLPHRAIGGQYELHVDRERDGTVTGATVSSARFVGKASTEDDDRIVDWELADRAAYQRDELNKLEKREKKSSELTTLSLADLKPRLQKLPPGQRAAFTAYLINYLH